jgi:hypothetical protein
MVAEYRVMDLVFLAMSMDYDSTPYLFVPYVYASLDDDLVSSLVEYHLF